MVRSLPLGLDAALKMMLAEIRPLPSEEVGLIDSVDRIAAQDLRARVNSPSVDASLKDGFAVRSSEVADAAPDCPVRLRLAGHVPAGCLQRLTVEPGTAIRILTGARIPEGADAVVSEEFVTTEGESVLVRTFAEAGRNILPKGSDVAVGARIAARGQRMSPGLVGMLAAAGLSRVPVIGSPEVAVIATGDEVVAPGQPLPEGKLYASNMANLAAWCRRYGLRTHLAVVPDDPDEIARALSGFTDRCDALVTSGGAWTGDHDIVAHILEKLGWRQVFHRIRIGPGKAVGFGLLRDKPVFILPGGPPSNLMGFLQIALPGLTALAGHARPGLPRANVRLAADLTGRFEDWTQFVYGILQNGGNGAGGNLPVFHPLRDRSRLQSMAEAGAVAAIPEGFTRIEAGSVIPVQLLE